MKNHAPPGPRAFAPSRARASSPRRRRSDLVYLDPPPTDLYLVEERYRAAGHSRIAGVDEAGRGPLAGPVVAASVILPKDVVFAGLDDSKRLSAARREALFVELTTHPAVEYAIGLADHVEIDRVNILNATRLAARRALCLLDPPPDLVLSDALTLPGSGLRAIPIVKGDAQVAAIAAASILAKVTRDRLMVTNAALFPEYGFERHKGYPTPLHRERVRACGPSPIHRMTFTSVAP